MLVGTGAGGTYLHMAATPVAVAGDRRVSEVFGDRLRVSPHVPVYASNEQQAVAILGSGVDTRAAMWNAVELIRDPFARKGFGETQLTGFLMFDFALINAGAYKRHSFRTS